ncbi:MULTISPECIES: hypothetical protein [Vitreoscilla]|uniref:Uncharacterized protein n=2 Tax=Vitreoscilla stercoraria TaxID=61 RepID=A0ABY4E889_VITST|nr:MULTISPECIES: hypothetical protein [Vitreoscilla]UOO91976.1 hypothetical protein LVJ81_10085 [Vitreoscilla stercoraria]
MGLAPLAMAEQWVILGSPSGIRYNSHTPRLSFVPESIDTQARTVVVKREQDQPAFNAEVRQSKATDLSVDSVIAQRHYRCDKRQFHTPAAQYLTDKGQVVHEYDYRLRQGLLFQLSNVDEGGEAEQTLFRRVCGF